ncbi:hypothetical protein G6671_01710 [Polynucleobacter paneuropaeus]|nr:hypothetical protein G6671_01710 [Polynucleobacter paneuropaeus]
MSAGDRATQYIGWEYFRKDLWRWPIGLNPNYGMEFSSSIILSDSIPLAAVFFKFFRFLLPDSFQYFGLWILLCFVLQSYFFFAITKTISGDIRVSFIAGILSIFLPPFLWRIAHHTSISAHWIILAALLVYVTQPIGDRRRALKWIGIIGVSTSIAAYLLAMVFLIWLADIWQRKIQNTLNVRSLLSELTASFIVIFAVLWVLGFFPIHAGYLSGGYGSHGLNIFSIINPQGLQNDVNDKWSYFIPSLGQREGDYEGFNYFGLGAGILTFSGIIIWAINRQISIPQRYHPLFFANLCFFIFAISNQVGIGDYQFTYWVPDIGVKIASTMRASGRFFWPVFYSSILLSIWVWYKFFPKKFFIILFFLTIVQVIDTNSGWKYLRSSFHPEVNLEKFAFPKVVDCLSRGYDKTRKLPAENAGKNWERIAFFSVTHGKPTDSIYMARINEPAYQKYRMNLSENIVNRNLDHDAIYFINHEYYSLISKKMGNEDLAIKVDEDLYIYVNKKFLSKSSAINECLYEK